MALAVSPLAAAPAAAHNPTNCYHGHQEEGSWHAHYLYDFWDNGTHWNVYEHYIWDGGYHHYQHTVAIPCGS